MNAIEAFTLAFPAGFITAITVVMLIDWRMK